MQALEGLVEEEALGSYVLVEKEDVLDAIGTFVAAYLATVPEAQHMKPAELQQALTSTFRVSASHVHLNIFKTMPAVTVLLPCQDYCHMFGTKHAWPITSSPFQVL